MPRVPSNRREESRRDFARLTEATMAVDIGAALIDVFMVLVVAVGLVLLAAMVREQLPHRRATPPKTHASRSTRTGFYGKLQVRMSSRRAA
jgi:hypothetical protein